MDAFYTSNFFILYTEGTFKKVEEVAGLNNAGRIISKLRFVYGTLLLMENVQE